MEEVAALVGVGITWYSALERGRSTHVSRNMLDAVAKALYLTEAEAAYLQALVEPRKGRTTQSAALPKIYMEVIHGFTAGPAMVLNGRWDVLAWNALAARVYFLSEQATLEDRNLIWRMFTDDRYERMHVDWERMAAQMVAILHMQYARHADDPQYHQLIEKLRTRDVRFERLWMTYKVSTYTPTTAQLDHSVFGRLELNYLSFDVPDIEDSLPSLRVVMQPPVTGSPTAERLQGVTRRALHAVKKRQTQ